MYRTWRPGGSASAAAVLGDAYPGYGYSDSGEVQPGSRMSLEGGLYQTGARFRLDGWSPDEWATFFDAAGRNVSQVYSTVSQRPIPTPPVPMVRTPIGGVPTWAIVAAVGLGGFLLLTAKSRR